MKEQGSRRESPADVRKKIADKRTKLGELAQQDNTRWDHAYERFKAAKPSEEASQAAWDAFYATEAHTQKSTDSAWLTAMQSVPGMTDAMAIAIWDAKDKIVTDSKEKATESDVADTQEAPQDPLEAMLKPGTPFEELNARYQESYGDTVAAFRKFDDAEDTLRGTIPREETAQAADDAIKIKQEAVEKATDIVWIRAMAEHPFINSSTVSEVWDTKKELRDEADW